MPFPGPVGGRKNTSNKYNVGSYYVLNYQIRDLLYGWFSFVIFFFGGGIVLHRFVFYSTIQGLVGI